MDTCNDLAVCSVIHIEWESENGQHYKAILMTPIAGKVPSKRLLHTPFLSDLVNALNGDYYLMSFFEANSDEKLGRQFRWTTVAKIRNDELANIIKELGPPGIISVDNITSPYIEANNFLEKEKARFETESKYFKAKAHIKHQQRQVESLDTSNENHDNDTKDYDAHDLYTAFDGDVDGMNEFLGKH